MSWLWEQGRSDVTAIELTLGGARVLLLENAASYARWLASGRKERG
jgi:hypothetical protein